ncbi:eCIS core domain-containing protein [Nostoc sp.]|uniref:eCIS core domain-containing protein n=1 Tax=Nostoc sp. TaxID=1180 RepID=UPI002FF83FD5
MREHVSQKKTTTGFSIPSLKHPIRGFGLESSAISRQAPPEIQPLHKSLTHDISRVPLRNPQAKLSISQPGDKYEQEADGVAQQVMQRMAQPANPQSLQREALPESKELQMKPLANSITPLVQREALPEDEEELQMKSLDNSTLQREALPEDEEELQMMPMVQRQASMPATPDLETSINQARGGGVAMANNIRQPMEQAFGADFSGVKVHTDGQSDQLNRSIQARAFTTGQDVFFGQGEYNPGSRGGQELLAHELTHVVQQNGGAVQREIKLGVKEGTLGLVQRMPKEIGGAELSWQPVVGEKMVRYCEGYEVTESGNKFTYKGRQDNNAAWFVAASGNYDPSMKSSRKYVATLPGGWTVSPMPPGEIFMNFEAGEFKGEAKHSNKIIVKENERGAYGLGKNVYEPLLNQITVSLNQEYKDPGANKKGNKGKKK